MRESEMLETAGLPTFYVTHVVTENAGGGNVRIWNCTSRNGVLIPNSEVIVPSHRLVLIAKNATECAVEVFNFEMMQIGVTAH